MSTSIIINPEEKAEEVIGKFTDGKIPINPLVIAKINNINVENVEFNQTNISGMLQITQNEQATIFVKYNDHSNRKRFTIAHELGHFFLHYEQNKTFVDKDLSFYRNNPELSSRDYEIEANQFAASLLMPREQVVREWVNRKNPAVDELAKIFGVSPSSMGFRITNLGLRG